jgi:hypothetical protein
MQITPQTTVETLVQKLQTIVSVKSIKGTSFVGVRNYQNKEGEVSNQTFIVGINYAKLMANDLAKLKAFDIATLDTTIPKDIVKEAHTKLIESLEKRLSSDEVKAELLANGDSTIIRSEAQQDAYTHISKGLKMKDGLLYIYGLMVRKEILRKIEYKAVNSKPLTIAQNLIKKAAMLQETKYKQFKLGSVETLVIKGIEI